MSRMLSGTKSAIVGVLGLSMGMSACTGGEATEAPAPKPAPPAAQAKAEPTTPLPGLIVVQSRFDSSRGSAEAQPAVAWLWRTDGDTWWDSEITDPESNVFHKGLWWRDGLLTIGAMGARLTHWTRDGKTWKPDVLWEKDFGGKFNRLRDIEIADVTGDGKENLVIATHDVGVVAVGTEGAEGWSFAELDPTENTFVHEIEIGDVDGDGVAEFYATPSGRNKSSGASQPGSVVRYDFKDGAFRRSTVVDWTESHAKEILVADLDGDGKDALYAVREATIEVTKLPNGKKEKKRLEPVKIVEMVKGAKGWTEKVVATLEDDQCRFLLMADVNHDGTQDLVAAGKKSGLWMLEQNGEALLKPTLIAKDSSGYEHTTHTADLDKDGKVEIYVASDEQRELRRFLWNGTGFDRKVIGALPKSAITWNIQDAVF